MHEAAFEASASLETNPERVSAKPFSDVNPNGNEPWPISASGTSALEHAPETYQPEVQPDSDSVARILESAPAEQEELLISRAAGIAGDDMPLTVRAHVAKLTKYDDPLTMDVYGKAMALPRDHRDRMTVFADLSRRGDYRYAWDEAVESAMAVGELDGHHALEDVLQGQLNVRRIDEVVDMAAMTAMPAHLRARIYRAAAVRYLAAGDVDVFHDTHSMMNSPSHNMAAEKDRAAVEFTGHLAENGASVIDQYMSLKTVSVPMKTWGHIKIATHSPDAKHDSVWGLVDEGLAKHWVTYSPEERLAMISDIHDADEYKRAAALGMRMGQYSQRTGISSATERDAGAEAIFRAARAQAMTDPEAALRMLDTLQEHNEEQFVVYADSGVSLSQHEKITPYVQGRMLEIRMRLDKIATQRVAIRIGQHPAVGMPDIPLFMPYDYDYPDISRNEFTSTVAEALAKAGDTANAIRLADTMPENPINAELKVNTLVAITRAMRNRRVIIEAGQIAIADI